MLWQALLWQVTDRARQTAGALSGTVWSGAKECVVRSHAVRGAWSSYFESISQDLWEERRPSEAVGIQEAEAGAEITFATDHMRCMPLRQ